MMHHDFKLKLSQLLWLLCLIPSSTRWYLSCWNQISYCLALVQQCSLYIVGTYVCAIGIIPWTSPNRDIVERIRVKISPYLMKEDKNSPTEFIGIQERTFKIVQLLWVYTVLWQNLWRDIVIVQTLFENQYRSTVNWQ